MPRKPGRPEITFTTEHLDEAKRLLGKAVYASRAVGQLCKAFGWGRNTGYRCLDEAKAEVLRGLIEAGSAGDPATAAALLFLSIMSDSKAANRDKVAAAVGLTRLLSTSRRPEATESGATEDYLGRLLAQQLIRQQQNHQQPGGQQP
ncbi:hypothetical protein [Limnoglobus roseus]|uniref:Uncharacterized protein n=1 Tax=Limnoglobus roseus TaxID=2598579 RepID=A0A5C1AET5_9BACT|nr:hypothetical protein [Limnoglobus roseus]QEL15624.1 hypothetical protein PX52LOC_02557 [Limnoglobus roseus]